MASDLISREALLEDLRESINWLHKIYGGLEYEDEKRICSAEMSSFTEVIFRVKDAPAVDAVEVVRCRECKYRDNVDECPMTYYEYIWDNRSGGLDEDKANKTEDDGFCHKGVKKDATD